jgi:peptidoglycan hydrolase CwlO-like protein
MVNFDPKYDELEQRLRQNEPQRPWKESFIPVGLAIVLVILGFNTGIIWDKIGSDEANIAHVRKMADANTEQINKLSRSMAVIGNQLENTNSSLTMINQKLAKLNDKIDRDGHGS